MQDFYLEYLGPILDNANVNPNSPSLAINPQS